MGKGLRFLRSVKLAVAIILVLTALSICATLVPQGKEAAFYERAYPLLLGQVLGATGFADFFRSVPFFVLTALFALNLAVCAVGRMVDRMRAGAPRRFGPDIVHLGLLLLIAGGALTFALRTEKTFALGEGDRAEISPSYSISVLSLEYRRYDNGAPEAWISTVAVFHGNEVEIPSASIAVNKPLRLRGVALYQSTFGAQGTLRLKDGEDAYTLSSGQGFKSGDSALYFTGVEKKPDGDWAAVFEQWEGDALVSRTSLSAGDPLEPFIVVGVEGRFVSGLLAVDDPGALPVIIALAVVGIGLSLTFIQKRREIGR
jgi:hypothetical protein